MNSGTWRGKEYNLNQVVVEYWLIAPIRHQVLDVYRPAFDPERAENPMGEEPPPHRYLFQCYLYQYHLIHLALDHIKVVSTCKIKFRVLVLNIN